MVFTILVVIGLERGVGMPFADEMLERLGHGSKGLVFIGNRGELLVFKIISA